MSAAKTQAWMNLSHLVKLILELRSWANICQTLSAQWGRVLSVFVWRQPLTQLFGQSGKFNPKPGCQIQTSVLVHIVFVSWEISTKTKLSLLPKQNGVQNIVGTWNDVDENI